MFDTDMLIGETFVAGAEAGERVLNPKTGELILDHPEASLQQVEAAVGAAEKAFPRWSSDDSGGALGPAAEACRRNRTQRRSLRRSRSAQLRQAAHSRAE